MVGPLLIQSASSGWVKIPKGSAAMHRWDFGEVVGRRWGRGRPFQSPGLPRIISGRHAMLAAAIEVHEEQEHGCPKDERSDGRDHI